MTKSAFSGRHEFGGEVLVSWYYIQTKACFLKSSRNNRIIAGLSRPIVEKSSDFHQIVISRARVDQARGSGASRYTQTEFLWDVTKPGSSMPENLLIRGNRELHRSKVANLGK